MLSDIRTCIQHNIFELVPVFQKQIITDPLLLHMDDYVSKLNL